jgi:CHAT domain-containing protein/Tfp pilus assembly protein PilF
MILSGQLVYAQPTQKFDESLPSANAGEIQRLGSLASQLMRDGRYQDALIPASKCLELSETFYGPEHPETGVALNDLGLVYQNRFEYGKALSLLQRSLKIAQSTMPVDEKVLGVRLNNLGELYKAMGNPEQALPLLKQALEIAEQLSGSQDRTTANRANNLAALYHEMGDYGQALPLFQQALKAMEQARGQNHPETAVIANNLAALFADMGAYGEAMPLYERSLLVFWKSLGIEHPYTRKCMSNLALLYQEKGEYVTARKLFEKALAISVGTDGREHPDTGTFLNNLALFHMARKNFKTALPLFEQSLKIAEKWLGPNHPSTGMLLNNLGLLHALMGNKTQARANIQRALLVAQRNTSPDLNWNVYLGLLEFHAPRKAQAGFDHNPGLAIYFGKQAVNTLQALKGSLKSNDDGLRQQFIGKVRGTYTRLAQVLVEQGRIAEAEQVLAMLKERELSELISRSDLQKTQADYVGVEHATAEQAAALSERAVRESTELAAMDLRLRNKEPLSPELEARRQTLLKNAEQWRADYQRWVTALPALFARTERSAEDARRMAQDHGVQGGRLQTLVRADPGAVGLHFVVTDEKIAIIVATARGSFGRSSVVNRSVLNRQIVALRLAIQTRTDPKPAAQSLYKMLIAPIVADLADAKAHTLVLSLTDTLRYLPFAALHDGNGYLIERYALVNHASVTNPQVKGNPGGWTVAALGVTEAASVGNRQFSALPAVQAELEGIVRRPVAGAGGSTGILPGQIYLDRAFDRTQFESALNGPYSVVHVASHFAFAPGNERNSVLLLGAGRTLSLQELSVMDFNQVEQLTLSACDTATGGGTNENGAEVEGLAAQVQLQGAKAVLASLWPVADDSTASLMRGFYGAHANNNKLSRAKALQQAQLALLHGRASDNTSTATSDNDQRSARIAGAQPQSAATPTDPAKPWAHPYFWAAFVLSGNWL